MERWGQRLVEHTMELTADRVFPPAAKAELPADIFTVQDVLPWASSVTPIAKPSWMTATASATGTGTGSAASPASSGSSSAATGGGGAAAYASGSAMSDEASAASASASAGPAIEPAASLLRRRENMWTMVWSETKPLSDIPHQRRMQEGALNRAAVDEVCALESSGTGAVSAADVTRIATSHGLMPLLHTIADASLALGLDEPIPAGYETATLLPRAIETAWRPVLRRYIRQPTLQWLYPMGLPVEEAARSDRYAR